MSLLSQSVSLLIASSAAGVMTAVYVFRTIAGLLYELALFVRLHHAE